MSISGRFWAEDVQDKLDRSSQLLISRVSPVTCGAGLCSLFCSPLLGTVQKKDDK